MAAGQGGLDLQPLLHPEHRLVLQGAVLHPDTIEEVVEVLGRRRHRSSGAVRGENALAWSDERTQAPPP